MVIKSLVSRSPWRITVTTDSAPSTTASDYVITRQDGGALAVAVTQAFLISATTVELALSEALQDDLVYILSMPNASGAPSALVGYRQPFVPQLTQNDEDPEAEAFGVDIDWLADTMTSNGDCPTVRGRQCLVNDLAAVAITSPGEIFHRPTSGVGAKQRVNSASTPGVSQLRGDLVREWAKDSRVRRGGIQTQIAVASTGQVTISGTIQPIAIDEVLAVKVSGGG